MPSDSQFIQNLNLEEPQSDRASIRIVMLTDVGDNSVEN
jgi:hypothetical protein